MITIPIDHTRAPPHHQHIHFYPHWNRRPPLYNVYAPHQSSPWMKALSAAIISSEVNGAQRKPRRTNRFEVRKEDGS
jgi:hypothetical protein